ncbi:MAG: HAD family hydrolase [Deltaproteobacteria bacterium]|nr:HAD family hydrolase [Deltaproteobacteria bacterium]
MNRPRLIVFDMDGVLIDVSRSYREAVRKTARLFLSGARGFEQLPDPFFPLADLAELKQTGGLNNDWDLTDLTLHLLFARIKRPVEPGWEDDARTLEEAIRHCDASDLAAFLNASTRPLMDLFGRYGRRRDPFVATFYRGDVGTGNVIKQIFQEVYLGPTLFRAQYGLEARFCREEGLIHRETLLIDPALLADLSRDSILAIATGRPQAEADFPLDRFGLRRYFRLMVTLDDCIREEERIRAVSGEPISLKKPDPYMLDRIPDLLGRNPGECYYLGDMPDDMHAARASKTGYRGVGVTLSAAEPEKLRHELLQAGADRILERYSDLPGIIG